VKKILPILVLALFFSSCEKDYLLPESELPQWLKSTIQKAEQAIEENSKTMDAMGAWKRTEWNNTHYYEYFNPLMSSMPSPISHSGDTLNVWVGDANTDYHKEKCCSIFVWKGPDFINIL
jgi:hypothetical protein